MSQRDAEGWAAALRNLVVIQPKTNAA